MRKFLLGVLAIVTLSTLAGGKYHWDQRVEAVQFNGQREEVVSVQKGGEDERKEKKEKAEEERKRLVQLDKLNYLPPELKETFKK